MTKAAAAVAKREAARKPAPIAAPAKASKAKTPAVTVSGDSPMVFSDTNA